MPGGAGAGATGAGAAAGAGAGAAAAAGATVLGCKTTDPDAEVCSALSATNTPSPSNTIGLQQGNGGFELEAPTGRWARWALAPEEADSENTTLAAVLSVCA